MQQLTSYRTTACEPAVTDTVPKVLFFIALIILGGDAIADPCRCKQPGDSLFRVTARPTLVASRPAAPAILPSISYRAIAIDDFMSLVGKPASISICLSKSTRGAIQVQSTKLAPWPVVIESIVRDYGLQIIIADTSVYVTCVLPTSSEEYLHRFVVISGCSGAGKSTLIEELAGLTVSIYLT